MSIGSRRRGPSDTRRADSGDHRTTPRKTPGRPLGLPLAPRGREAIVRQIQTELTRVGCYAGEPNGLWTSSARQAMKEFTERVNAKLPIDEPDGLLLTLVQGYPDKVCGVPCRPGHSLSASTHQCIPNALLAAAGKPAVAAAGHKLVLTNSAWTGKTDEPSPFIQAPSDASSSPESAASPPPAPVLRRTTKRAQQRPATGERSWAQHLFRHLDRLSLN